MTQAETMTKILGKYISNDDLHNEYDVYKAMTEYAEQECIAFAEWIICNDYRMYQYQKWRQPKILTRFTTKQLYTLYQGKH